MIPICIIKLHYYISSNDRGIVCLPEGSVLGPLLIYVNAIVHVSDKLYCVLFADDINIIYSSKNINSIEIND